MRKIIVLLPPLLAASCGSARPRLNPMKATALKFILTLAIGGLAGCSGAGDLGQLDQSFRPQLRFKDANVAVTYEPKLSINPHADQPNVLTVAGKRFPYVQGSSPYYYSLGNGRRILFSLNRVGGISDKRTLVVADLNTARIQSIDISDHMWGSHLYSKSRSWTDTVCQIGPDKVLLRHQCFDDSTEMEVLLEPLKLLNWRRYCEGHITSQGP